MSHVISFPGFGLEFTINRVAFQIGNHPVYWYGVIIAVGFLLAVTWVCHRSREFGISQDEVIDMLIVNVPLSIIGTRLYYVIFNYQLYKNPDGTPNFSSIFRIWDGGLAIYGGIITCLLVLFVFCRYKKISYLAFADLGVQGLLIGQCIGRWGNFTNAEAFGSETDVLWRMGIDGGNGIIFVHPTFLYESLWNLIGFVIIYIISKNILKYDGQILLTYICWYGLGRTIIEGLRSDSLYFFGLTIFGMPIRTSQMIAFVSFVTALILLIVNHFRKHDDGQRYVNKRKTIISGKSAM